MGGVIKHIRVNVFVDVQRTKLSGKFFENPFFKNKKKKSKI